MSPREQSISEYIQNAKRELGRFSISGQPLADGVRAMRLELEACEAKIAHYEHMIDDFVKEILNAK